MRIKTVGLMMVLAMSAVSASGQETIPPAIAAGLKPLDTVSSTLKDGVLRVVMRRPVVNQMMYKNIAMLTVCEPTWSKPKTGWANARIERVEVVNEIQAQGFAFVDAKIFCSALAKIKGPDEAAFFQKWTLVCVAGNPCRPRRPGEVIAGD